MTVITFNQDLTWSQCQVAGIHHRDMGFSQIAQPLLDKAI